MTLLTLLLQVGDLFRTRAFNFHARKAAPPRSLDTLTLRELYALKTETSNRALSAKMLADIYKKLESIHVQSTCRINTPLITQCLQSPIVSRYTNLLMRTFWSHGLDCPYIFSACSCVCV